MNSNSKLYPLILIALAAFMFSCNQGKIQKLEESNKLMLEQSTQKDSMLNSFMAAFNEFDENLQMIKEKESLISMNSDGSDLRENGKEQILQDIQMINQLLDDNRVIIEDLTKKLESSDMKLGEFRRMVSRLKKQMGEKDTEIASLKENLAEMDFTIETLNRRADTLHQFTQRLSQQTETQLSKITEQEQAINEQDSTINEQITQINTGYYIAGTAKELKNQNILARKSLKKDFDQSAFTKIDITQVNSIPVDTRKAEILTNHPSDSYVFNREDKQIKSLEITDPERFWKTSKYLVLVMN